MLEKLTEDFATRWGIVGVLLLAALVYHRPILAAMKSITRNQLVEALVQTISVQNGHFSANNELFRGLGPQLAELRDNTRASAENTARIVELMTELLAVQRGIEKELIRRGRT